MKGIHGKAKAVAGIFSVLAWVVGFFGGAMAFIIFVVGMTDGADFWFNAAAAIVIGIYTAIAWAGISLATIVAGYIASKTVEEWVPVAAPTAPQYWPQNNPANYPQR